MITTGYGSPFVGRVEELKTLNAALQQLNGGKGSMVAIAGEPGMGKTRFMAEIADIAERQDKQVLWSQMVEDPGAPPFLCWMLALRACVQQEANRELLSSMGPTASELAHILPELREEFSLPGSPPLQQSIANYQISDAVTQLLLAVAARQPVVLLLDNLHLADRSSLAVLEHLCSQIAGQPILVVGAYRESEFHGRIPLRSSINGLSRTKGFVRLVMQGFSRAEVAELLHRYMTFPLPSVLIDTVYQQSGGNPLFINEVGGMLDRTFRNRKLPEHGFHFAVPESLREVIAFRLDNLPEETRRMLGIAAVLGREFNLDCLANIENSWASSVVEILEPAKSAGMIESLGGQQLLFHHVLFREVLYAEHSTVARVLLHRKAREYLERRYDDNLEAYISQIAHHAFESAQAGDDGKAVYYCRKAAEIAVERRAFSEASGLFERAIQAAELNQSSDTNVRYDLLMGLGQAQYLSGQLNASTTTLMKAAIQSYLERNWEHLAEALFRFQHVCQQSGLRHISSVPLHLSVLEHLPETACKLRASVLASLAKAYRTAGDPEKAIRTFHESLALAREQDDPELLLGCLLKGNWVIGRHPEGAQMGLEVALEAFALAKELGRQNEALDSLTDIVFQLCDLGDIEEFERRLDTLKSLAVNSRQIHFLSNAIGFETAYAILQGKWLPALQGAKKTRAHVPLQAVSGLQGRFAFQIFAIYKALGSLDEFADVLDKIIEADDTSGLWLPGEILLHCELGQYKRAEAALVKLGDLRQLVQDDLYPVTLVYLAESCAKLRDIQRCTQLFELLSPYRELNITVPGTLMLGAASGYLALLAMSIGKTEEANNLFEEAIAMNSRMHAAPALAQTMVDYARLLLQGSKKQDQLKARAMMDQALPLVKKMGLRPLLDQIKSLDRDLDMGTLSRREIQVLELVAAGLSNDKVADSLHISHSTVATHLRNILRKTGAHNRTEAVDYGRRMRVLVSR